MLDFNIPEQIFQSAQQGPRPLDTAKQLECQPLHLCNFAPIIWAELLNKKK